MPWRTIVRGQVSSVVTPFTMRATGRRARWSKKCSPLKVTTGSVSPEPSSAATAVVAPRPASTQPSSETTSTGFVSAGSRWTSKISVISRAHGAVSSASAAISKSRPICTGKPSTDPWSPAPAPAT